MTWEQIESSWKQLKGDVQQQTRASQVTRRPLADSRESVEEALVSYKRSLHHGTAFIRRRNAVPTDAVRNEQAGKPVQNEQAGKPVRIEQAKWTAAR
jgi:hypothetical protein